MKVIWQSEIDPYASAVLRKHWPTVINHGDIRTIRAGTVDRPDVLCGGFPCQDISNAGKRAGIDGERSGLWGEYARIIGELGPAYVVMENVSALLVRGLERVLRDLAALGFDAEWHCIPASAVGAPHERDRTWIVGYAQRLNHTEQLIRRVPYQAWPKARLGQLVRVHGPAFRDEAISEFGGMDDGLPNGVDRLRCLGNAIVPQVAEVIGRAIVEAQMERAA
jgi:DNA (cytosine-5)-methyltransferase 1